MHQNVSCVQALCIRRTRTRSLCIRRTLCRHVTIGTPMVIFAVLTVFWLFFLLFWIVFEDWYTVGTLLVHCWYSLGRLVAIGTPMVLSVFDDWYSVKNSQKTVKQQKMTIRVPIVTCLHRVRRIHKAYTTLDRLCTPLPCETSIACAWAVATARRPWAGLTVCVYMDVMRLATVCCRVLLHSLLPTDDACSSSSLSTTVIKFSIFSDPSSQTFRSPARTPSNTVILKQLHCCPRLNVRVHSSKVELAAAGVHPVGMISLHASV